jgi:RTX calcium-binding nonapeptide repeat (4 copies)
MPPMHGPARRFSLVLAAAIVAALAAAAALQARPFDATNADCGHFDKSKIKCKAGHGTRAAPTPTHRHWPAFDGIRWQVIANNDTGESVTATQWSDELLGRNGSDTLSGGPASDVIWGDSNPTVNGPGQHDVLDGGAGNDWMYASHGSNTIDGGAGNDHILAAFGHGTIDCGPGDDTVAAKSTYKVRNCEHRVHHII